MKLVNQIGFDQVPTNSPPACTTPGIVRCWHFGSCSHNQSVPELDNLQLRCRLLEWAQQRRPGSRIDPNALAGLADLSVTLLSTVVLLILRRPPSLTSP